jgi:hypothetical protein
MIKDCNKLEAPNWDDIHSATSESQQFAQFRPFSQTGPTAAQAENRIWVVDLQLARSQFVQQLLGDP